MNSKPLDLVVVGAGIVGLATAHRYLTEHPGKSVVVVERESGPAYHQTGRNSGVLHSGIYYTPWVPEGGTSGDRPEHHGDLL